MDLVFNVGMSEELSEGMSECWNVGGHVGMSEEMSDLMKKCRSVSELSEKCPIVGNQLSPTTTNTESFRRSRLR